MSEKFLPGVIDDDDDDDDDDRSREQNATLRAMSTTLTTTTRASNAFHAFPRATRFSNAQSRGVRMEHPRASLASSPSDGLVLPGDTVVVIGANGGVGQLVCARLASAGYEVTALTRRSAEFEAEALNARGLSGNVERRGGVDCRDAKALATSKAFENVDAVVCCLGTTAFPSKRWRDVDGSWTNGPRETDFESVRNVVDVIKRKSPKCKRFVMVSSVGVLRTNVMPFIILNAFGVLKCKRQGEEYVERSGLNFTLLRPGRLTDGPYTSFDLNTLLKATSGTRRKVQIGGGDDVLLPEATSRLVVAEAACAALACAATVNRAYELGSTEGDGPGSNLEKWSELFHSV